MRIAAATESTRLARELQTGIAQALAVIVVETEAAQLLVAAGDPEASRRSGRSRRQPVAPSPTCGGRSASCAAPPATTTPTPDALQGRSSRASNRAPPPTGRSDPVAALG